MWASLDLSPSIGDHLPTEGRLTNSCIQARRKCQADPTCNATYHYLNSCASSISTSSPAEEPLVPEDCMEAAQQLRNSSLMSCTCHRRMKNQATCLNIYWTIHPARSLGEAPILEWAKLGKMALGSWFLILLDMGHMVDSDRDDNEALHLTSVRNARSNWLYPLGPRILPSLPTTSPFLLPGNMWLPLGRSLNQAKAQHGNSWNRWIWRGSGGKWS